MAKQSLLTQPKQNVCSGCGGSGQISYFRGVSRFVMDWDDCPDCLGTGYTVESPESAENTHPKKEDS